MKRTVTKRLWVAVLAALLALSGAAGAWGVTFNATTFPDDNFRGYLSSTYSWNDGDDLTITTTKITDVTSLYLGGEGIVNLTGIEHFANLTDLTCSDNQLTALDVSQNKDLQRLDCYNNQLTSLDVSGLTALIYLYCSYNQLTSLDVSQNTKLDNLDCSNNQLTALDVSGLTVLSSLSCSDNQLTALDVSQNTNLMSLYTGGNRFVSLDLSSRTFNGLVLYGQTRDGFELTKSGDNWTADLGALVGTAYIGKISDVQGDGSPAASYAGGVATFTSRPGSVTYLYNTGATAASDPDAHNMEVTLNVLSALEKLNVTISGNETLTVKPGETGSVTLTAEVSGDSSDSTTALLSGASEDLYDLTWTASPDPLPAGLSFSNGVLSVAATAAGTHTVEITATVSSSDTGITAGTASHTVTVTAGNTPGPSPAATLTSLDVTVSGNDLTVNRGQTGRVTLTASVTGGYSDGATTALTDGE